jgi:hypothetical protein
VSTDSFLSQRLTELSIIATMRYMLAIAEKILLFDWQLALEKFPLKSTTS